MFVGHRINPTEGTFWNDVSHRFAFRCLDEIKKWGTSAIGHVGACPGRARYDHGHSDGSTDHKPRLVQLRVTREAALVVGAASRPH